jgi:hypothetical protein
VICSIAMQDSVVPFEVIICGLVVLLTLLAIFSFVQLLVNATASVSWAHYGRSGKPLCCRLMRY